MAKAVKRIRQRRDPRTKRVLAKVQDPKLLKELGTELCQLTVDFLREMDVSRKDRLDMISAATATNKRRAKPSRAVMHKFLALSDMLSVWRSDKRYTGSEGLPRRLPINGKGLTLETLARRFLPDTPLGEVMRIITLQGEVQLHKDGKVALAGSSVLIHEKTKEQSLASFITRVRALAANQLHNIALPSEVKGKGYFERQVTGVLSEKAFRKYSQEVRPQLQDICDHVESGLQVAPSRRGGKNGKVCGLALFLFQEEGKMY
jgi:hypothetical protein